MSFQTGEVSVLMGFADYATASQLKAKGYQALTTPVSLYGFAPDSINRVPSWPNQKVREALEYAINKEAIVKALGYGFLSVLNQAADSRWTIAYNQKSLVDYIIQQKPNNY